jgi:hypothetical protein
VTHIYLNDNAIGDEGALAFADALKVNTSVTHINLNRNVIDESNRASVNAMVARNTRLRCVFLFDARQMLLSLMGGCADECSVVWPYLLKSGDTDGTVEPAETIRVEFEDVLAERRRRLHAMREAAASS